MKTELYERTREARALSLQRLLEKQTPDGRWSEKFNPYSFHNALYIIMLRTTGLIDQAESVREELRLICHLITQVNPDGGFYKFAGSPSSRSVTKLSLLTLRMALGEINPKHHNRRWFRKNMILDKELERRIKKTSFNAEKFIRNKSSETDIRYELDHIIPSSFMLSYINPNKFFIPLPVFSTEIISFLTRSKALSVLYDRLNTLSRKIFPAASILSRRIMERNPYFHPIFSLLNKSKLLSRLRNRSIETLVCWLKAEQNENGNWLYNTPYTILNIMALREAGVPLDDSTIQKARAFLRNNIFPDGNGGAFLNFVNADIWDTCLSVFACFSIGDHPLINDKLHSSIQFLLDCQGEDGGFAWASGSKNDSDSDSTASVLRILALARKKADDALLMKIDRVLKKGKSYLLTKQNKRGGYNVWGKTLPKAKPGAVGLVKQIAFDVDSADLTARVLSSLCTNGLGISNGIVRKCLHYLIEQQCRNGAWWCRWWAGYITGTGYVLEALSQLGFRYRSYQFEHDNLLQKTHEAMEKAIDFLLAHQNADGGWGESIGSDFSIKLAGIGKSKPLQTACALHVLLLCGYPADTPGIKRGMECLLGSMTQDGRWEDNQTTFTFFSRSFYYQYPLMNNTVPLLALTAYLQVCEGI
ncbi:prenyltransferase/squalene oxidase repeat-containing protein [Acidobacteriota bacterium]